MRRPGVLLALLAIVSIHAVLLWIYHSPSPKELWGDEVLYREAADRLLAGEDPQLESLWPPLYPRMLALALRLSGGSLLGMQLLQTGLLMIVALLLRDLCRRWSGSKRAGDIVALLTLAYPPLVAFGHYLWPEMLHLALMVGAVWILVARRKQMPWLVLLGLMLGLALLTKSLLGPFLPVLLVPLIVEGRWRDRLLRLAIVLAMLVVAVLPTLVTSYVRTGRAAIADSSRFNLWVGLNDASRRNFREDAAAREFKRYIKSAEDTRGRNEVLDRKTAALLGERGMLVVLRDQFARQYFRLFDKDSFLTDQLPGGVLASRGSGYRDPPAAVAAGLRYLSYAIYAMILVAAVWGCALRPPRVAVWAWPVLGFVAYNLLIFLFLHVKTRYRVQLLPVVFVYAAIAFDSWLPGGDRPGLSKAGLGVAAAVSALLLFLVFGAGLLA